ncbi:MAG: nitrophenyl compound nitroreductase subunit ArsF family protein [Tidjanibacter sp.]|nr:nitrophenyl compound nitroreductase subunit ArsF family protein [Tidjanibacter sp.]
MKSRIILTAVLLSLVAVSCAHNLSKNKYLQPNGVEILCFHTSQRCATCRAIESLAQQVAAEFADQQDSGKLRLKVIDISTLEGEQLADRYEVASTSIVITQWFDGVERFENITPLAFKTARTSPEVFVKELQTRVEELLK